MNPHYEEEFEFSVFNEVDCTELLSYKHIKSYDN